MDYMSHIAVILCYNLYRKYASLLAFKRK